MHALSPALGLSSLGKQWGLVPNTGAAPTFCGLLLETRFYFVFLARESLSFPLPHIAQVAYRRIAQQHRNIGISSFLLKKSLGKHHRKCFFLHLFFFSER